MAPGPRLLAVARFICGGTHADIGSDHALLPKYLLENARVQKIIVVEKTQQPYNTAKATLQGLNADIRLGDGLAALEENEVGSLSITGMGASKMVQILAAHPECLPTLLTLQPNDNAKPLRVWAREAGFRLRAEDMAQGYWRYTVLQFEKSHSADESYNDLPLEPALTYGPHLLKSKHPLLREELEHQHLRLTQLGEHGKRELEVVEQALAIVSSQ